MLREILLLTGQASQQLALTRLLHAHNPALSFRCVVTSEQLQTIDAASLRHTRLLAFTSGVIVPPRILGALGYGAYNFHPGPPNYAGWAPAHFALYDGATEFGATAHQMIERVDAGPIIGVEKFPVGEGIGVRELEQIAFIRLAFLFWRLSSKLASREAPPVLPIRWSGTKSTRQMYVDMCRLPADVTKEEMARRIRAFSDDFRGIYPTIRVHGFDFRCVDAAPIDKPRSDETTQTTSTDNSPPFALSA